MHLFLFLIFLFFSITISTHPHPMGCGSGYATGVSQRYLCGSLWMELKANLLCSTDKVKSTRNLMGVSWAIKSVLTCNTIPLINYIRVVSFSITKGGSGNKQGSASGRPGLFAGRWSTTSSDGRIQERNREILHRWWNKDWSHCAGHGVRQQHWHV